MGTGIERKFLVTSDSWRAHATPGERMRQGYLARAERASVRIRLAGERAWLNVKGATVGVSRPEFDYPVPPQDARAMLESLCVGTIVEKTRHLVEHAGHRWEIDVFEGENAGLVVAELELESEDEAFASPDWVGADVSHDPRYYNAALAERPWGTWPASEREAAG